MPDLPTLPTSDAAYWQDPYPILREAREKSPLARTDEDLLVVLRWDDAVEAFRAALNKPGVDNVVSLKMQLGTALYNAGELKTARSTFASVADDPEQGDQAANWVKFVSAEIQRKQALQGT